MTDRVKELAAADELERLARIVQDAEAVRTLRTVQEEAEAGLATD